MAEKVTIVEIPSRGERQRADNCNGLDDSAIGAGQGSFEHVYDKQIPNKTCEQS